MRYLFLLRRCAVFVGILVLPILLLALFPSVFLGTDLMFGPFQFKIMQIRSINYTFRSESEELHTEGANNSESIYSYEGLNINEYIIMNKNKTDPTVSNKLVRSNSSLSSTYSPQSLMYDNRTSTDSHETGDQQTNIGNNMGTELTSINIDNINKSSTVKNSFVYNSTPPLVVILYSSTQRSGSSMLGELITSMGYPSSYSFEPLRKIEKDLPCMNNRTCVSNHLRRVYDCSLYRYTRKRKCLKSSYRVMKLVRSNLDFVSDALQDPQFNIKIVHLTRDPRGSLRSIPGNWGQGGHDPKTRCTAINDDIEQYAILLKKYPDRVMNVSYETFCVNSENNTKEIYKFIFGTDILPKSTVEYMNEHLVNKGVKQHFFNTVRNTSTHYQDWRRQIKKSFFTKIEKELFCRVIIKSMNFRLFKTIDVVRNLSISVFT